MFGRFPFAHCHFKIENNLLLGEIPFSEKTKVSTMLNQGCGNTMPDLSDMVPFHPGQVENFYLLVLEQVQMY